MKSYFTNKTIWLTGASSGIGKAIALELAKHKPKLILSSEDAVSLHVVSQQCTTIGADITELVMDLSDNNSIDNAIDKVIKEHTKIDILILNAGISQRSNAAETSLDVHNRVMQINFHSNVRITHAFLPIMLKQGGGHIVVTSSISGKFGFPLRSAYAASKHALHGYYESIMLENAKHNMYVTIVCPGRVQTMISYNALSGDGKKHGAMDDGQKYGISAEQCAKQYVQAIKNKKKEVYIGRKEILMVYIKRFFPGIFYKIASKIKST
jgi:dehydrogenase/reductase SDR family protein 7B